ncbi:hypothetical protein B0H14DRAFT_3474424 [Mycena olivaceomarginata]|nr:hypothetical protein B0H14DRAFT_3474424 [Mycena olivaceomarginata]
MTQSQYYTLLPTASSIVPPATSAPAPNTSPDLVMAFAPVHALPTAPATHCAPVELPEWPAHECRRERLQRVDACNKHWGLKGSDVICGSRGAVFRLAEDTDLDDIHIRGHRDASVVQ